jgi:hypothetical protein
MVNDVTVNGAVVIGRKTGLGLGLGERHVTCDNGT